MLRNRRIADAPDRGRYGSRFRLRLRMRRESFCQAECGFEIDFERLQIAAVDADQVAAGIERALQFRFVMGFRIRRRGLVRAPLRPAQPVLFWSRAATIAEWHRRNWRGFDDLEFVDDEILAQAGQGTGGGGLAQVVERALKNGSSVNTDRAAAPARSRSRASS